MRGVIGFLTRASCALFLAVAVAPRPAAADLSLDVEPARYELTAPAGATRTLPLSVRNTGTAPTHVVASVNDFTLGPDGRYAFLPPGSARYSAGTWTTINPREFDLAPGAFQEIRYSVAVPSRAAGEYSSLVFFTTRPPRARNAFGVMERVASRVYVLVGGDARVAGRIDGVSARAAADGRQYALDFTNTGTMHVYLNGEVEILQGDVVVERMTLPKDVLVERGGSRAITLFGRRLAAGRYAAVAIVDYGGANRVAGRTEFIVR
jgi:hypothetical protein